MELTGGPGFRLPKKRGCDLGVGSHTLYFFKTTLLYGNIYGSRTFLPLFYVKCDSVAFFECFETIANNAGVVNKDIRAVFLFDEAVSLLVVEPLHRAICHSDNSLLSSKFHGFRLQAATFDKWSIP